MAVRIIEGTTEGDRPCAVFYCSTMMAAFGPIMESREEAEAFRETLPDDPRRISLTKLQEALHKFRGEEE